MNLTFTTELPEAQAFFDLFVTTGWNEYYELTPAELYSALQNSWFTLSAYDGAKLAGFSRIVCDGTVHAMIYDLIVLPQYQNKGIGSIILKKVVEYCVEHKIRDIQLFSAEGKKEFYGKFGFKERPVNAPGMEIRDKI